MHRIKLFWIMLGYYFQQQRFPTKSDKFSTDSASPNRQLAMEGPLSFKNFLDSQADEVHPSQA